MLDYPPETLTEPSEVAERVIEQDRAIEALETIEATGDSERANARLLVKAYKSRLRAIIGTTPTWVGNRIFEASESIPDPRAVLHGEN